MQNSTTSNPEENLNETVQIPLSKGFYATIDLQDYERVSKYKWTALQTEWTVYARRTWRGPEGKQHSMYLHRFIMEAEKGVEVDHRDGDGRNCTKANMRMATKANNAQNQKKKKSNTSGTKGVGFHKPTGKWQAYIGYERIQKHLGFYATKEEAIAVRRAAAHLLHADFHKPE